MGDLLVVVFLIALALAFDFVNGFHDSANSIATVVSTRVLTPRQAVVWAAFFNFAAAFGFGLSVAATVGKGIVHPEVVSQQLIFSTLVGAIAWDLITWYYGLPTSSSHALIGGLIGAAVVQSGLEAVVWAGVERTSLFIVVAPLIGMGLGLILMVAVIRLFWGFAPGQVKAWFARGQLLSAAAYSLGHGTNDAQKTMGIIAVLLYSSGYLGQEFYIPAWVVFAAYAAIAMGTLAGGWRIVRTMGMRITDLQTYNGFCAEAAAAVSLFGTAWAGIPVSTTHTIAGAIMGVGATRRLSAVRWGVAGRIVWAWVLTIPASAAISAVLMFLVGRWFP